MLAFAIPDPLGWAVQYVISLGNDDHEGLPAIRCTELLVDLLYS